MWELQSADEVLDYHQDWTAWIEDGDDIASSDWSISPDSPAITSAPILTDESIDTSGMLTTVFVSGLVLGQSYQLKNIVVTSDGRTGSREITIRCDAQS